MVGALKALGLYACGTRLGSVLGAGNGSVDGLVGVLVLLVRFVWGGWRGFGAAREVTGRGSRIRAGLVLVLGILG